MVEKDKRKKLSLLLKRLYEDVKMWCIGGIETSMYS